MREQLILADGTKLWLRTPQISDVPQIFEAVDSSHAEISSWMDWCHEDFSLKDVETWVQESLASERDCPGTIWDELEQQCLGGCGLNEMHPRYFSANLGYWVRTSHAGRGIISQAASKVAQHGFQELNLVRVEIVIDLNNHVSQRVAEKVGATREGIIRNGLMHFGEALDAALYSLVPEDFV